MGLLGVFLERNIIQSLKKNPAEALGKAGEPQLHLSVAPMEIRQCHEQQGAGVGAGGKDGANWQSQYINLRFSSVH